MDPNVLLGVSSLILFIVFIGYFGYVIYHQQKVDPEEKPVYGNNSKSEILRWLQQDKDYIASHGLRCDGIDPMLFQQSVAQTLYHAAIELALGGVDARQQGARELGHGKFFGAKLLGQLRQGIGVHFLRLFYSMTLGTRYNAASTCGALRW